jgi:hypothetical protein
VHAVPSRSLENYGSPRTDAGGEELGTPIISRVLAPIGIAAG